MKATSVLKTFICIGHLILFITTGSSAYALGGSDAGGGGTFVHKQYSQQLLFWDLYVNNPEYDDIEHGDQIEIKDIRSPYSGVWVDYRELKSFLFLKERLRKWKSRAHKLVKIITDDGQMLRGHESEYPEVQGFYYLLLGTTLNIESIFEIHVPQNFSTHEKVKVYPGAFFNQKTERVFLNLPIWNRAGLKSQAACLLHERMRNIQLDFNLTNAEVQNIVASIILKDPADTSEEDYDDNLFSPLNYKPAQHLLNFPNPFQTAIGEFFGYNVPLVGRFFYKESSLLKASELDKDFECKKKNINPGQPLHPQNLYSVICKSLDSTYDEIKAAVKSNILTDQPLKPISLRSNGRWNTNSKREKFVLTPAPSVLLNSSTCRQILAQHKDPTHFNSYRFPLNCQKKGLGGTGLLYFETPYRNIFELEMQIDLSVRIDGGSHIVVDVMGNEIMLYYNTLPPGTHKIVVRYDFDEKSIAIFQNDNGSYKTNLPLVVKPFRNNVLKSSRIDFVFGIYNHATIESVRLLE